MQLLAAKDYKVAPPSNTDVLLGSSIKIQEHKLEFI